MLRSLVLRTWCRNTANVYMFVGSENILKPIKKPGKEWAGACFRQRV